MMLAGSVNESHRMRSAFQAANSEDGKAGFETEPFEFLDPIDARARDEAGRRKKPKPPALSAHSSPTSALSERRW